MSYRIARPAYFRAQKVASELFDSAEANLGFRPGQAYAYVMDEMELLQDHEQPGENIVVLTAIYKEALKRGVVLSRDDPYTNDMLEILSSSYLAYDERFFEGLNMSDEERSCLLCDMETVKSEILRGGS